jgi:hypothetical protein
MKEILASYKEQIKAAEDKGLIKKGKGTKVFNSLRDYCKGLPYLNEADDVVMGLDEGDEESRSRTISRLLQAGNHQEPPSH